MGLITDTIRGKNRKSKGDNEPTREELMSHHCYSEDILIDGFVSPIVLPYDRLHELKGSSSVIEMADKCHLPTREMELLLSFDYIEPNTRQLMSISNAYHVPVLWLLGYHTTMEKGLNRNDSIILSALEKRNAAENTRNRKGESGILADFLRDTADRRVRKANMDISITAARIIATEHLPLSDKELYQLNGQPVYVEYTAGGSEWGLVIGDTIITAGGEVEIETNGTSFRAYQTPGNARTL